jgi:hypothetical protein
MKFWKDKEGNELTFKEFTKRWKDGVDGITPTQKIKTQITATRISLLGIFLGLIVTTIAYENLWWVAIILFGALINTGVQYLGLTQQRDSLLEHEENCEEMSLDDLMMDDVEELKKKDKEDGS